MSKYGNITGGDWMAEHTFNIVGDNRRGVACCGGFLSNMEDVQKLHDESVANAHLIANAGTAANKLTALGYDGPECVARLVEIVEALERANIAAYLLSRLKED